jgi:hypothetical protein
LHNGVDSLLAFGVLLFHPLFAFPPVLRVSSKKFIHFPEDFLQAFAFPSLHPAKGCRINPHPPRQFLLAQAVH